MAALDQLDRGFTLAHAAFTKQQDALAIYLHQHTVPSDARGELDVQFGDQPGHKLGSAVDRAQQGHLVRLCRIHHVFGHREVAGNDHRRRIEGKIVIDARGPFLVVILVEKCKFAFPENLNALAVEIIEKTAQLQTGTVYLRR